jgi:hypothetical protein
MTARAAALAVRATGFGLGAGHRRAIRHGLTLAGAIVTAYVVAWKVRDGVAVDAAVYFAIDLDNLYAGAAAGVQTTYLYSPAFAQLVAPLTMLPWDVFLALWTALSGIALVLLAGPLTIPVLFTEPVLYELDVANVNLLIGLAIVAGFRWPAAWAFVLLTKVVPGIGLVWFAVRREWRQLAIAMGVTAAIVAVSFALAPGLWFEWIAAVPSSGTDKTAVVTTFPLVARLPFALALVVWGARTDRRWVLPIAAVIAMPAWRYATFAILAACIPLIRWPTLGRS